MMAVIIAICSWISIPGPVPFKHDPGFISDLKLFPEAKVFGDKTLLNNHPDRCNSSAFVDGDGAVICARVSFAEPHAPGDIIAFNLEFNGVRRPGEYRAYSLSFADKEQDVIPALSPSSLAFVELA